jgi:hypothetical protein
MKLIPLTQGQFAQVDDSDYEWLNQWKWCAYKDNNTYYAVRSIVLDDGKQVSIRMHREIMNTPKGMDCDHRDHNGLNCQRFNMRNCTRSQNLMNKRSRGSSRYLGVSIIKGKYNTYIRANILGTRLGTFRTEEEAAKAYDEKAKILYGEFANLNFK